MGTISDKLMRVINTKEDIRQALISKGYDVPTSIPFKEYVKMILDLPCKADSFPDIEGIVARYSASGLTNEQMAANPVWVDKTGNGHDLQMKNFAWGGMSGVGGYEMNFNLWTNNVPSIPDISMSTTTTSVSVSVGNSTYNNNLIYIHMNNWDINKNHWLKVTSTYEDGDLVFKFYNDNNSKNIELPANGYVNIPAYPEFKGNYMYISTTSNKQGSFTIEQLPLYPDQAWTVVGKTNEDEDRATIANITGNGNNLVLSNFGFAEGSGYGLYGENYNGGRWVKSTDRADITWTSYSVNITSVKVASTQLYYQSYPEQPSFTVPSYKIKVYGLKDGQTLSYKQVTPEGQQIYKISEDGIYTLPSFLFKANGDWYGFTLDKIQETCDITIEQIPEYEGYLVTDGVDDKIVSSVFEMGKDFTIVGDWKFIDNKKSGTGLVKGSSFYIYNTMIGLDLYINSGSVKNSLDGIKSINAACSDGRAYDRNWNEILANTGNIVGSGGTLEVSSSGGRFDRIAFKNLAIYPRILSKDDCIKAYNYLQTLKSK